MSHGDTNYPGNIAIDIDISRENQKTIDRELKMNPVCKYLSYIHKCDFQIGDVLIRKELIGRDKKDEPMFKTVPAAHNNPAPRKYVVVHKNEYGVPFIKQLTLRMKLGKRVFCLANYDPDHIRFETDPSQLDHILLQGDDVEYDPLQDFRRFDKTNKKV